MKSKTEKILIVMNVLTWIAFIGLMVKAGAILVSFGISMISPEGSRNLYNGLNLYEVRQYSFVHYAVSALLMFILEVMKAYAAYLLIKVLSEIKLSSPFKIEIARYLEKISYFILGTWFTALIYNMHMKWLSEKFPGLEENLLSLDFIFFAGVVFVISQIFKKGVELQTENELTV